MDATPLIVWQSVLSLILRIVLLLFDLSNHFIGIFKYLWNVYNLSLLVISLAIIFPKNDWKEYKTKPTAERIANAIAD